MPSLRPDAGRVWLPLLLLVPAPSLGILAALYLSPGPIGQSVFWLSKIWLVLFPWAWTFLAESGQSVQVTFRCRGYGIGVLSGLGFGLLIGAAGIWIGEAWIDLETMRGRLAEAGLGRPSVYLAGAVYWCLLNALIEEYVWRWFVLGRCRRLMGPGPAVAVSALLFTLHHVLALAAFTDWRVTALVAGGVFIGGLAWAGLRQWSGTIWPGYVSHVLADIGVFVVGWQLLFG